MGGGAEKSGRRSPKPPGRGPPKGRGPPGAPPTGSQEELDAYLAWLCREGLRRCYPERGAAVEERLAKELAVIRDVGYAGYFLIVWDFIRYAREQGIPVGPGRGSAAGSVVAYLLGITDIDPLRYGLIFERFLNPARVSPPDIDEIPGEDVKLFQRAVRRAPLRQQRGVLGATPLLRPLLEASVAEPQAMPDGLIARYLAPFVGRDGVEQLHTIVRSIRAQDLHEEELRSIAAPTLIVAGERDRWLDLKTAERLAGTIPEARLARIPGVGRLIPEEAPDELTELILRFEEGRQA
jgi:hypothetical protein